MSFNPITTTTGVARTWNEIGSGVYGESTVTFGQPLSALRISRGKLNQKTGIVTSSMARVLEKDIVALDGTKQRVQMSVSVIISIPMHPDFTVALVDESAGLISEFLAPATLDRMLKGEQ